MGSRAIEVMAGNDNVLVKSGVVLVKARHFLVLVQGYKAMWHRSTCSQVMILLVVCTQ